MTTYAIFTSDANLVESFDQEDEARAALEAIREQDPENGDEFEIIPFPDGGRALEPAPRPGIGAGA